MGPSDFLRNAAILGIPQLTRNSSGVPTGLSTGGKSLSVIDKPVEMLSGTAVPASCVTTAVDEVLASFAIPAGIPGVNSILQFEPLWTFTSSANNKILRVKVAGVTIYTATCTTTANPVPVITLANRNSLSSQIQTFGTPTAYTIDFSVDVTVEITGQRANAADTLTLEYYRALHYVGA